jgi:pimeloyl-ACP methyl ester carboxylesterase
MTPIVLVPGHMSTAELFRHQVPALAPYGPVTVAPTLEGRTIRELATAALASAPPRFALAGISMGGYISLEMMRLAPERVTRLALLSTTARPDAPELSKERRTFVEKARGGRFEYLMERALTAFVHPVHRSDAALLEVCMGMARTLGVDGLVRQSEAIIARSDSRPGLSAISVPTLVLVGDEDPLFPREHSEEIAAAIPKARLVVVPDCGHISTLEQPEAVNRALVEWLRSL